MLVAETKLSSALLSKVCFLHTFLEICSIFNIIKTAGDVPVSTGRNDFCVQWSGDLITDTTTSAKKPVLFHAPALRACAA